MWFQDKDDVGIAFHEHFDLDSDLIPHEVIALVATVVRVDPSRP